MFPAIQKHNVCTQLWAPVQATSWIMAIIFVQFILILFWFCVNNTQNNRYNLKIKSDHYANEPSSINNNYNYSNKTTVAATTRNTNRNKNHISSIQKAAVIIVPQKQSKENEETRTRILKTKKLKRNAHKEKANQSNHIPTRVSSQQR